ncbi:MAG TPA: FtsK/SpoIIIE domain-containing protein [Micromonosporaceae bacterium]|nr:FtsK/SpoIIIE domain-containing protein [Micromonosporaceae bacterium]
MVSVRSRIARAAGLHRQAAATAVAAERVLAGYAPDRRPDATQRELAERLRALAAQLAPGWLGVPLKPAAASHPLGASEAPVHVRIGTAHPLDDAVFPVVVPLLRRGHLAIDADARDPRAAAALRALLLRLLAAAPAGRLLVRVVDAATQGALFASFAALADAGLMPPPVTDRSGLQAVLAEAEQWVRAGGTARPAPAHPASAHPASAHPASAHPSEPEPGERKPGEPESTAREPEAGAGPAPAAHSGVPRQRPAVARPRAGGRLLLVVIASLPELTDGDDLARLAALAEAGPPAGLHLVVAGWPPPPLTAETTQGRLPLATQIGVRNPYAVVAGPPEAPFADPDPVLGAPISLDDDPPAELVERVCRELAAQAAVASRVRLADLLPEAPQWTQSTARELATVVGCAGDTPITLRFNEVTPHWVVGGRAGSGKSAFLLTVLCGLAARYGPDQLALYLLDPGRGDAFAPLLPPAGAGPDATWLPQVRAAGIETDPAYALAVLRDIDAELRRRAELAEQPAGGQLPRIVCVLDELPALIAGWHATPDSRAATDRDATAAEIAALVTALARGGGRHGIHLLLAGRAVGRSPALHADRDSASGRFRVRVALPGGEDVLDAANDSAAGLPLGTAVVNTAGGLGGPRGATRGHETVVRFPDPYADSATVAGLRERLWRAGPAGSAPPPVFVGSAVAHLSDDPTYRAGREALAGPAALLGRRLDAALSTAVLTFDATPGRHLAVFDPGEAGADLLDAATRGLAVQHQPGQVRFLLAPLAPGTRRAAEEVATAVRAAGHRVSLVDRKAVGHRLRDLAGAGPATYLVIFGADGLDVRNSVLHAALRDGPARGHHLLAWWHRPHRFLEALGPAATEDVTGLVFVATPAAEVELVVGRPVRWQPQPNRALLHDRRADRSTVFIPFLRPGRLW